MSRIAGSFGLILPQGHADDKTENALFREIVKPFEPPAWAAFVIIGRDAAYETDVGDLCLGSLGLGRCEDGKRLKDFVTSRPRTFDQRTWRPKLAGERPPKTFWIFGGDVMAELSRRGA